MLETAANLRFANPPGRHRRHASRSSQATLELTVLVVIDVLLSTSPTLWLRRDDRETHQGS